MLTPFNSCSSCLFKNGIKVKSASLPTWKAKNKPYLNNQTIFVTQSVYVNTNGFYIPKPENPMTDVMSPSDSAKRCQHSVNYSLGYLVYDEICKWLLHFTSP